ncbi:MAG: 16S rRNA processing protein RimM [Armatimonadetes bacterium]|nr:16S rRNA processing protein RimM [Armatimonadota bacterium]
MTSSRNSASCEKTESVLIGTLVGPFSLRGEVKLYPVTDFPERIPTLKAIRLHLPDGTWETRSVLSARPHRGLYLLRLEGCNDVDAAEALRGTEVWIGIEQAVPPPPGQYWVHQIIGLRVVTPQGEELGTVRNVLRTGANDVYVADDLLIPATRDAILEIDLERGVIVVPSREYLTGEAAR